MPKSRVRKTVKDRKKRATLVKQLARSVMNGYTQMVNPRNWPEGSPEQQSARDLKAGKPISPTLPDRPLRP